MFALKISIFELKNSMLKTKTSIMKKQPRNLLNPEAVIQNAMFILISYITSLPLSELDLLQ